MVSSKTRIENKRELILDAAVRVFSASGYDNARMEEIAETAGVGKGTIYEYFDSKLQLFNEMIIKCWEVYTDTVTADQIQDLSFEQMIWKTIEGHFRFSKDNQQLTRILFWDTEIMNSELREWLNFRRERMEHLMQQIVEQAIRKNEIKQVDYMMVYLLISGLVGSIWAVTTMEDWDIDVTQLADQLTDTIMNGLKR